MPSPFDDIFGTKGPQWTTEQITSRIRSEAKAQGVDPDLAVAVATQESWLSPEAKGDKGKSIGLFQLQEAAAKDAGIDPRWREDPGLNIYGGVRYLKQKLAQSKGNVDEALSRYNRGTPDYRGIGDPNYVQNVKQFLPGGQQAARQQPGMLARVANVFSPASAEAATPQQAAPSAMWDDIFGAQKPAQATTPAPPTATSTPEQDAAYRAAVGQQEPGASPQTAPAPTTPPAASPAPPAPDTSWTPGMRFQALPSITQLEPADRLQKTRDFERLKPEMQDEFLRSEEPAAGGLAVGVGPVAQSQPVTDQAALLAVARGAPSDLTVDIEKPSPPQAPPAAPQAPSGPMRPAGLTKLTPDMDEDAIIAALGYDPAVIKKAPGYRPGVFKEGVTDPAGLEAKILNSPVGGFARGAQDVAEGLVQLAARGGQKLGVVSPERVAFYEAMMKLSEANYQQNIRQGSKVDPQTGEAGIFSDPSRLVGQAAAVPIPGGAATTIPRILARGAATGAVSGAVQPVQGTGTQPGSEADDFWTQKAWQTGTGGVLGGGLSVAGEKVVAPVVNRGINWARGVVNPAYQKIIELGERFDVRLSVPEITQSPFGQKIETGLEAVPGTGYGTFRRTEQRQVRRAAEGPLMREGLQQDIAATPWRDLPAVEAAARGTGQRAKEARLLLEELNDAGNDWGRAVQGSGKLNLFQDRLRAEKLYDTVTELAEPLGNMRLPQTTKAIDEAIARANADVLPSPEVKREVLGALNRVRAEISPTESARPSMGVRDPVTGTLRAQPMTPTTSVPDTTYGRMRGLRSSLGDLQREAAEPAVARYLGGVKSALEDDMHRFATQSNVPQLSKAAQAADTWYKTRVVKYREGTLAKAIEKDMPDEIYNQFVRRGKDRAQYFYNGLDPKGQAAVRYGMVEEAVDKAMSGPNPEIFSPQRFVSAMHKIQEASGVFFKGVPQWEIDGFTKLMQHTPRAGQYMENPPTGWRTGVLGLLFNPWLYLQAVGAGQGVKQLFTSRAGRSLMLAANDLQPGSPALQRAWNQFARQVPRAAALAGSGQADQPSQPSR